MDGVVLGDVAIGRGGEQQVLGEWGG